MIENIRIIKKIFCGQYVTDSGSVIAGIALCNIHRLALILTIKFQRTTLPLSSGESCVLCPLDGANLHLWTHRRWGKSYPLKRCG
jgi:hypothetical protein